MSTVSASIVLTVLTVLLYQTVNSVISSTMVQTRPTLPLLPTVISSINMTSPTPETLIVFLDDYITNVRWRNKPPSVGPPWSSLDDHGTQPSGPPWLSLGPDGN